MKAAWLSLLLVAGPARADTRTPIEARYEHSAEASWAAKKVHSARAIPVAPREAWTLEGDGRLAIHPASDSPSVRVDVTLTGQKALPVATARRKIDNEDWRAYNRIAFWLRTDAVGFPVLTLMVTVRNAGAQPLAEVHAREATHQVTIPNGKWTRILWDIPHVNRDRVTSIDFRPWVNKRLTDPWDRAAYEIRGIEVQRVDADAYEGWSVAPGKIAFSHSGYRPAAQKTAIASRLEASTFDVIRAGGGQVVLTRPVRAVRSRLGSFQVLDFSELRQPGLYLLRAGNTRTRPFRVGDDVWDASIAKTLNFFYGERCGVEVPGVHEACHRDWQAVFGDKRIIMNGGWHDAGDLSQGLFHTGEAVHAMFALASAWKASARNSALLGLLEQEARWGLDWVHKVRFPGGRRIGFASMNLWTNGIIGDEDDRSRVALNNPAANYIAAAAGASAYNYLKDTDPRLAWRSLAIAEEDWRHAIGGVESPETQSSPAFAATAMELASMGTVASLELYRATGKAEYARKAQELSRTILDSQQVEYVGSQFPLAGFFYTGPDRAAIFHQFHRGNEQAPLMALAMLCEAFPDHPDWTRWYAAAAIYAEYQKRAASTTAPYLVLPASVYRDDEWQTIVEGDRYGSDRQSYRRQVLEGMAMGGGYYLRAFPVWFTRRGNYGVLLSQAKALSAVSRLRGDRAGMELAERQLMWVVGRNPFVQSTMWGEGYDFAPQYSVSVGDLVGALPVGMMTRGDADRPYWPATNTYVFKEVWVHPSARWLSILEDFVAPPVGSSVELVVNGKQQPGGTVLVTAQAKGKAGRHTFELRAHNLRVAEPKQTVVLEAGSSRTLQWKGRAAAGNAPWVAVVIPDGQVRSARDVTGYATEK